jgi:hypothetical protein
MEKVCFRTVSSAVEDYIFGLLLQDMNPAHFQTVPGYRSRRPGSIPGAARFSEK